MDQKIDIHLSTENLKCHQSKLYECENHTPHTKKTRDGIKSDIANEVT